jgi:undecaprenyl-diphosphatase
MLPFHVQGLRARLSRIEIRTLLAVLAPAALLSAFIHIASEVSEGDAEAFDRAALAALRTPGEPHNPVGPAWLDAAAIDLTSLGSTSVLTLITVVAAGYLAIAGRLRSGLALAAGVAAGSILSRLLKTTFERPRPEFIADGVIVDTWSFPSGHAMMSAIAFLTIGALLSQAEHRRRVKVFIMAGALALTLLVGASRVYLGVHYPTDVLAGWAVGAAWALLWRKANRAFAGRASAPPD